jgi:hypothetical protein
MNDEFNKYALFRYLKRYAPTLDGTGLRASRRLEGYLSSDSEINAYRAVMYYIEKGLGEHQKVIQQVIEEVAKVQNRDRYTGYANCLFSFGWTGEDLKHEGKAKHFSRKANSIKLSQKLCLLAGTDPPEEPILVRRLFPPANPYASLRKVTSKDLLLFFYRKPLVFHKNLERIFLNQLHKRIIWVCIEESQVSIKLGKAFMPEFKEEERTPEMKKIEKEIFRYSERGLVNAWVEEASTEQLLEGIKKARGLFKEELLNISTDITHVEVYTEYSLSDFGDPDLLLILHDVEGNTIAVFIEAKLCPFLTSSPGRKIKPEYYEKNASSVLHELFLKAVFWKNRKDIEKKNIKLYDNEKERKIGKDKMVLDLAQKLTNCSEAYFVALTTDMNLSEDKRKEIKNLIIQISKKSPGTKWNEFTYILSWQDLAQMKDLPGFQKTLKENVVKMTFPNIEDVDPMELNNFWQQVSSKLQHGRERKRKGKWTLYNENEKKAVATYSITHGFWGPVAEFYLIHDKSRHVVPCSKEDYKPDVESDEFKELMNKIKS